MRAPLAGSVQCAAWEVFVFATGGRGVKAHPRGAWKPDGPSTRLMPWAVGCGDGPALRVGDGLAGPEGAVERGGVGVGAAAGAVEEAEGDGVAEAADAGGVPPEACGVRPWLASRAAAPATRRTHAPM